MTLITHNAYWRIKLSLCLNYFIFAILLNSVGILILQSIIHYHITKSTGGNLDAHKDLTIAIFSFFAASSLPKLGYKNSMLIGLAIIFIACIITPIINSYTAIKILLVSVGVGFSFIKVSAYSSVGLITDNEKQHASFINFMEGIFMIGVLFGFWLFGFFVKSSLFSWLDTYWVMAGLILIAIFFLASARLNESGTVTKNSAFKQGFIEMLKLNRKPLTLLFVFNIFMYVFVEQGINTWLPTFNNQVLHIGNAMSIEMGSIFAAAIAIGRLSASFILERKHVAWDKFLSLAIILAAIIIGLLLFKDKQHHSHIVTSWAAIPVIGYIFPLVGVFLAPIYPTLCALALSALPKNRQSAMMGLIMVFSALGGTVGSKLVGVVFQYFGGHVALLTTLIPLLLLFIALFPYKKLRAKEAA